MTHPPNFEASCALMRDLGFTLEEARSTPQSFGSWFIRGTARSKSIRVVWDGRDEALSVQEPSLSALPGDWADRWTAGQGYKHKPSELRDGLLSVLSG